MTSLPVSKRQTGNEHIIKGIKFLFGYINFQENKQENTINKIRMSSYKLDIYKEGYPDRLNKQRVIKWNTNKHTIE